MALHKLGKTVLDPQTFAFETGVTFRGLTISENSEGYNVVIRGYDQSGLPVYCMTHDTDYLDGLTRLIWAVSRGNGANLWRKDKYANGG